MVIVIKIINKNSSSHNIRKRKQNKKQISKQTGTEWCSNFWVGIIDLRESLPWKESEILILKRFRLKEAGRFQTVNEIVSLTFDF